MFINQTDIENESYEINVGDILSPQRNTYGKSTIWENISDVWEYHLFDETISNFRAVLKESGENDPDYNVVESINNFYPDLANNPNYLRKMSVASNDNSLQEIGDNIRANLESKDNLSEAGFFYRAMLEMTAYAVQDPLIWTPLGMAKWAHQPFSKTFYKYGATIGATTVPYETARVRADPTAHPVEVPIVLGAATAFGSVLGPVLGKLFKKQLAYDKNLLKEVVTDAVDDIDTVFKTFGSDDYISATIGGARAKSMDELGIEIVDDGKGLPKVQYKEDSGPRSIPYGKKGYQRARAFLSRPFLLEQSEYDMVKDIGLLWTRDKTLSHHIFTDDINYIIDLPDRIAGDASTMLASNLSRATPVSVDTLTKQNWYTKMYAVREAIDTGFASINGILPAGSAALRSWQGIYPAMSRASVRDQLARVPGFGQIAEAVGIGKRQKVSREEFERMVASEIMHPKKDVLPAVAQAATELKKIFKEFGDEIEAQGLSSSVQNLTTRLKKSQEYLDRLNAMELTSWNKHWLPDARRRIKDEVKEYEFRLEMTKALPFKTTKSTENYFPLFWNVGKIMKNKEEFISLLEREFVRDNPNKSAEGLTPRERAEQTVERIIRSEGHFDNSGMTSKRMKHLMSRRLDVKGEWKFDYIDMRVESVMRNYIRRMGATIEMAKLGDGDRTLSNIFEEINNKFQNIQKKLHTSDEFSKLSAKEKKELSDKLILQEQEIIDHVQTLRDRVLGTFVSGTNAHTYRARAARTLKNIGTTLLAGKFTLNSIADLGTMALHYGAKKHFNAFFKKLSPEKNPELAKIFEEGKREARLAGSALDTVLHSANARQMEMDFVIPGERTAFENFFEDSANVMFKANLLNYWTTAQKEFATVLSVDSIIKDSVRLANLYKKNGNVIAKEVEKDWMRLRASGLKDKDILDIGFNRNGVNWKRQDFKNGFIIEEQRGGVKVNEQKLTEDDFMYIADTESWGKVNGKKNGPDVASRFHSAIHNEVAMAVMTPSIATRPGWLEGNWRGIPHSKKFAREKLKAQNIITNIQSRISENSKELSRLGYKFTSPDDTMPFHQKMVHTAKTTKDKDLKKALDYQLKLYEEVEEFKQTYNNVSRNYKPLLSSFFQFRTFGISAATKIAGVALQGRAKYPMQGLALLMGLAYMSQWAKNPRAWSNKDFDEKLIQAAEYSGMSSWLLDFNNTVETLSLNNAGLRPTFGMNSKWDYESGWEAFGSAMGTPYVAPINIINLLTNGIIGGEMSKRERLQLFYRTLPFNNLLFVDQPLGLNNYIGGRNAVDSIADKLWNEPDANSKWKRKQKRKRTEKRLEEIGVE